MPAKSGGATLRVTQVKSSISHIARNRGTLRALGLHGIGSTVEVPANDATRGMVRQVRFLVTVEEAAGSGRPVAANDGSRRMGGDEEKS
jgi:large subunit ribosomal protein L30